MATPGYDEPDEEPADDLGAHLNEDADHPQRRLDLYFRQLSDGRREAYDRMPIDPMIDVSTALRRMPAHWLTAACRLLHLEDPAGLRSNRKARTFALMGALSSARQLSLALEKLPKRSLSALRVVLESGGCVALIMLTQEFGEMDGDGWLWDEEVPSSCLGVLRSYALLHVGRLRVEQDGGLPDLYVPVAVVPLDLRSVLCTMLNVRVNDPFGRMEAPAETDDLQAALVGARRYFEQPDITLGIDCATIEDFLHRSAAAGFSAFDVWRHIDLLFEFAAHNLHELHDCNDFCAFHLSELATEFVDRRQSPRWTLAQRRALVETVNRLFVHLRAIGVASADAEEEIAFGTRTMLAGKRRLSLIRRPVPLGGEVVFMYDDDENPGTQRRYTINHRRIAVVWWADFDQDWDAMIARCSTITDGVRKADLARELMNLDTSICDLLLACSEEDEVETAGIWFQNDPVLFVSAW
ncbi:MAG: hypothetical protein NTZ50_12070 [Chloroflexi bacterium]|nr:hypothetical protein [Chloroflexota bacterium]